MPAGTKSCVVLETRSAEALIEFQLAIVCHPAAVDTGCASGATAGAALVGASAAGARDAPAVFAARLPRPGGISTLSMELK